MKPFESKKRKEKATNKFLLDLFEGIDSVQIKSDGVYEDKALSNDIVLTINEPLKIQDFKKLIAIIEPKEDFHCMCLGDYAIELLGQKQVKTTIGFHHGVSIRLNQWTGDAELKYPNELLEFFSNLGLKNPIEQRNSDIERTNKFERESVNWLNNSPKSYSKFWKQINDFDESYIPELQKDLRNEYNEQNELILALLKSFGTTQNLWSGYPMYEMISQTLLNKFKLEEIISAFSDSNKERTESIGLGRFLFSWDYRKELKKQYHKLNKELINILSGVFKDIKDRKGLESIEKILSAKPRNYS